MRKLISICTCALVIILAFPIHAYAQQPEDFSISETGSIGVSGKVQVDPELIRLKIEKIAPDKQINQEDVVTYKITYGNENSRPTPLSLQVHWEKGQFANTSRPSLDLLDYVDGSATNAYGNTAPLIDLENDTITWHIQLFPAVTTNKTIEFQLRTRDINTVNQEVRVPVSLYAIDPSGVPGTETAFIYKYRIGVSSLATPISTNSDTIPPQTSVPQIKPVPTFPRISKLTIDQVSSSTIRLAAITSHATPLQVNYGRNISNLDKQLISVDTTTRHSIQIDNLQPKTTYYLRFKIPGTNAYWGNEIYTFTTASKENMEAVTNPMFTVLTYRGTVMQIDTIMPKKKLEKIVKIWKNGILDVTISTPLALKNIKSIEAFIQDAQVLGMTTEQHEELQSQSTQLTLLDYPLYAGKLKMPDKKGNLELIVRSRDIFGNVIEQVVAKIQTIDPFIIKNENTAQPINDAKVIISKLNPNTQIYDEISINAPFQNPLYTNEEGIVPLPLLPGKYKAVITHNAYETAQIAFEVTPETTVLPSVQMTPRLPLSKLTKDMQISILILLSILLSIIAFLILVKTPKKKVKPRKLASKF